MISSLNHSLILVLVKACLCESFLIDRCQCVTVAGMISDFVDVTSDVPQGSVLGPGPVSTVVSNFFPNEFRRSRSINY